jgi:hypothetical protein
MSDSLDGLLAVEDQAKQSAQQTLDVSRGRAINYTELNVLRTDVWGTPRECIVEARTEHDNELQGACQWVFWTRLTRLTRTAMSGLSSGTYS